MLRLAILSFLVVFGTMIFGMGVALAAATYEVSPEAESTFREIGKLEAFTKGLDFIRGDDANTLTDQKAICAIPAPPFKEKLRGEYYKKRLSELGLKDIKMDAAGNVFGVLPGAGKGPKLLVEAHMDTVFPEGTNTVAVEKGGKLYAPGIADDSRGLAAVLTVVRAFNATGIKTVGDVVFCGTVGEEGLGDLRGMKAFFRDNRDIAGSISVDGTSVKRVTYLATGSHRYEITFSGPGGHSFAAFGTPSAIHAMGRAIAKIADIQTPNNPKTTFTVGTVSGGASVNAIAAEATMLLDMRSNSQEELLSLEGKILALLQQAVDEENARWGSDKISVTYKLVGDRPAGTQAADAIIVQSAWLATKAIGQQPDLMIASSTNANLPISIGVPAVTLGGGGQDGQNHSPGEWFDPKDAYLGPQKVFATILGLVGVDGVTKPLLSSPPKY
ncbi:MAG: M20/M25/M40 family metallo-hydrolase [Negativicutes bacterium]|nr:M20/M25/M40 family metallo-hydrolase [Negativicutes bacterium]